MILPATRAGEPPVASVASGGLDAARCDALTQLIRRTYFFTHGAEPTPEQIRALAAATTSEEIGELLATSTPTPAIALPERAPQSTWLTAEEVRDAEQARLLAGHHGILRLVDAVAGMVNLHHSPAAPALRQCWVEFIMAKRCEGLQRNSLQAYTQNLRQFIEANPDRRPDTITPQEIASYLLGWTNPYTRAMRWQMLATFFTWLVRQQYVRQNPVYLAMRKPRTPRPERRILTPAVARVVLRSAAPTETIGFWCLSLFAGMRTGEVRALQRLPDPWSAVRLDEHVIDLRDGITKTWPRLIPIGPVLHQWLRWLKTRDQPFMPRNFYFKCQPVRRALAAALGPPPEPRASGRDVTVENIGRRTYISCRLALAGASFAEVSADVGNTEEVIRKHYLGRVSRDKANEYFQLTPARLGASRSLRHLPP